MNDKKNDELEILLSMFSSKLSILSNYGIDLLKYIAQNEKANKFGHTPIVLSLRHTMELLEGISILIKYQLADPSLLLLRGMFESVIQTLYILAKDMEQRGLTFMYYDLLSNIDWYDKLDNSTQKGKAFLSLMEKDIFLRSTKFNKPENFDEKRSSLKNIRKMTEYSKIHREYEKQNLGGKKVKHWYSLFDGPKNIEQVAINIGLGGTYQILYRQLSEAVHGVGIIRGKIISEDGKGAILDIRSPEKIQFVVSTSISIANQLILQIINIMCPEKINTFREFYTREIREVYLRVTKEEYIKIKP